MAATMKVVEATGDGLRRIATTVNLLGVDGFSLTDTNYEAYPIKVRSTSAFTNTYERWIRFEFSGPYEAVGDFRFWMPNLVIPDGWILAWGITDTFARPTSGDSIIAVNPIPTVDPGSQNVPSGTVENPVLPNTRDVTAWLVLQASVVQDAVSEVLMTGGLTYEFTWAEY